MNNYITVDLNDYFNHKSILENPNMEVINGDMDERFFNPAFLPDSLDVIKVSGIPFIFPDKAPDKYDNLTLKNQVVKIPEGMYNSLHFLGCSEYGNYREKIILNYAEGDFEEIKLQFCDWYKGKTIWEFDLCKTYETALTGDNNIGIPVYIYHYVHPIINTDKLLNSIEFSCNQNVHIYAITLGCKK